jgi:positive phototaxis protein PixI
MEMVSEFWSRSTLSGTPTTEQKAGVGQQFLRFHLMPDTTALLGVNQITEVLTIPVGQIVPIPQMPAWVMGVYNWRGEILWMVDLGHLVGLTPLYLEATGRSNHTAIVVNPERQEPGRQRAGRQKTGKKTLGLLVNRVEDMEWGNPDLIQSPPQSAMNSKLVKFLRGYWLKSNGEILVVLDGNSIIAGMPQPEISNAL